MEAILIMALLTFLLGPAGAIPHSLVLGFSALETAAIVSLIHLLLVPVWFAIFSVVKYDDLYRWRITSKLIKGGERLGFDLRATVQDFERRAGQLGFGFGVVGFTFLLGVSWAALGASVLNIKRKTIFVSVAAGAVLSALFWTASFSWAVGFLPSPWVLYVATGLLTLFWIIHKKLHEQKLVREMRMSLRKLGVEMVFKPKKR